jgi:single-strand DNA-binding protein
MSGINVFTFSGNLGRDAEQRFSAAGESIVSFSVPVTSGFGDKEITSWIRCAMFGDRGAKVLPYLKKGQLVGVSGEFSARPWTNKEGQEQISNEVRVNSLNLLGSKPAGGGNRAPDNDTSDYAPAPAKNKPKPSFDDLGSDIPF